MKGKRVIAGILLAEILAVTLAGCKNTDNTKEENESTESKSLLRAIESARQMSTNIKMETENGGQLREDFLKEKRCRRDKNMGWSGSC